MPVVASSRIGRDQAQRDGTRSLHLYATDTAGKVHSRRVHVPANADAQALLREFVAHLEADLPERDAEALRETIRAGNPDLSRLNFLTSREAVGKSLEAFLEIKDPQTALKVARWLDTDVPAEWLDDQPKIKTEIQAQVTRLKAVETQLDEIDGAVKNG